MRRGRSIGMPTTIHLIEDVRVPEDVGKASVFVCWDAQNGAYRPSAPPRHPKRCLTLFLPPVRGADQDWVRALHGALVAQKREVCIEWEVRPSRPSWSAFRAHV
jgi:hypothetical protein